MTSKRYEVTHSVHYIGGRLVSPDCGVDSIVTLPDGVEPGRWLVEVVASAVEIVKPVALMPGAEHVGPYKAVHVPVGNFAVHDANGLQLGETFKKAGQGEAKAAAESAAALLNVDAVGGGAAASADDAPLSNNLPDA